MHKSPRAPLPGMLLAFLLLGMAPAFACNLFSSSKTPAPEPAEALRQTLQALSLPTPTAGPIILATAANTGTPVELGQATGTVPPAGIIQATEAVAGGPFATLTMLPDGPPVLGDSYTYTIRWGDTASSVALRFMVEPHVITAQTGVGEAYLQPGDLLVIPREIGYATLPYPLLPDSELVYSPSALNFDLDEFIRQAGGFLSTYSEVVSGMEISGAQAIQRVADELSVNPRLLLALLEYRGGWVYGPPSSQNALVYPIGFNIPDRKGLYEEIKVTATQLNKGYYGWRQGTELHVIFPDGRTMRISPDLNAGTAALQRLLGMFFRKAEDWQNALYGANSFPALYQRMYGDPWARAAAVEPLIPPELAQPRLELPFQPGIQWIFTSGPHEAWNAGTPRGALDFAPPINHDPICDVSADWVTAPAPGVVTRSANGTVALDLDGDGSEQTGWVIIHLHLATSERIPTGTRVAEGDSLGHPSCEGGAATARHVHISRKYNGEWLPATGPLPFELSGWAAQPSEKNFKGALEKDGVLLYPNLYKESIITR